jgi:hypothetical protein
MSNDVQCVTSSDETQQRQAMLAAGLLTMVFCFGHYFGKTACWLIILVALILLSNYPVLGVPVWLWTVLAVWLVFR